MAKVHTVRRARKHWKCEKCGRAIVPGQPYKWVKPRPGRFTTGRKRIRCYRCPYWKQSELTFSKMAGVYSAQEDFDDLKSTWTPEDGLEDVQEALNEAASQIEQVADEYDESATNIEDGFGHPTSQSEELEDKASQLRDWAQEVRDALDSVDASGEHKDLHDDVHNVVGIVDECPV